MTRLSTLQVASGALAALCVAALPAPAQASFPGRNGVIAFASDRGRSHDVWKMHPDGSGAVRVTAVGPYDDRPSWAPDGRRIAFVRRAAGQGFRLWTVGADGSGSAPVGDTPAFGTAWSPDGRRIAFDRSSAPGAPTDLFTLPLPSGPPRILTRDPAPDVDPAWQPR